MNSDLSVREDMLSLTLADIDLFMTFPTKTQPNEVKIVNAER